MNVISILPLSALSFPTGEGWHQDVVAGLGHAKRLRKPVRKSREYTILYSFTMTYYLYNLSKCIYVIGI